ncbi:SPOR domain-containing protein [Acidithiobacillus sp. HP-6]|uniref:SPOR domain-containing protein n=1 Tax=unclassified Acidithiobacillus TaxID=2614800 RepID=UPI001879A398|nr:MULTISPECIES: SPOR domain-containing protein [unclassified Acidithiobacillus]MBE7561822.1 SPOR domain-containing protein [Acidithiobacillus sp. HP-6]MBE7570338.1 SPOR domain-containing protein [Acidithiobacillus sp. HP-2]MDD2750189.1 SPOR domain-containing protein [Acidithiobacillus sp.]
MNRQKHMKNTDNVARPTREMQTGHKRLGVLLFIIFLLVILLAVSFIWKSALVSESGKAKMTTSGATSVFLTLPKTLAATGSAVSTAKTLLLTSATRSPSLPVPAMSSTSPAKVAAAVPASVKPVPIPHACQRAGWYVQLGAFGKVTMAEQLLQEVGKAGVKACVGTLSVNHLFRVLVGPQSSKSDAGSAAMGIGKKSGQQGAYPQYWAPE